jgi:hypothetical protein
LEEVIDPDNWGFPLIKLIPKIPDGPLEPAEIRSIKTMIYTWDTVYS